MCLTILDYTQWKAIGEIINDMVAISPHASLTILDKDAEEALATGPLPYPAVAAIGMVTAPSKKDILTRMSYIMTTTIAEVKNATV